MNERTQATSVLIDNTTMIGVGQLAADPATFLSPFTLLDLETFCEAFILYDRVISLRGQSFNYLMKALNARSLGSMTDLLFELQDAGTFSTEWASEEGWMQDHKIMEMLIALDINPEPDIVLPDVVIDAYLVRAGAFAGSGITDRTRRVVNANLSDLYFPTLVYFLTSMYEGMPYLASSVRVPVAGYIARRVNHSSNTVISKCLAACEAPLKDRVAKATKEFPNSDFRLVLPPLLKLVLSECDTPGDIIPAIYRLREHTSVKRTRQWIREFQSAVDVGDVDAVYKSLGTLDTLERENASEPDRFISDIQSLLTIGAAPVSTVLSIAKNHSSRILSWIRNRHFLFLKNLSQSGQVMESNAALIKKVFGRYLSDTELTTFADLRGIDVKSSDS